MRPLALARAASVAALLGLLLPWFGLNKGLMDLAAWPTGVAAPLPIVLATQPAALFVTALGWGATFLATALLAVFAAFLAARGRFGGDAFIAFLVTGSAVLLFLFVFLPLVTILSAVAYEGHEFAPAAAIARLFAPEAWSLACVTSHQGCGAVWNSLLLAILAGLLSTLLGLAFALLATRGEVRAAFLFRAMTILPLITPPFVVSLALIVLFGRTGIVTQFLWIHFDIPRSRWIYGLPGVLLAQVLAMAPIAFVLLEGAVRAIGPSLEEAAATMGARRITIFRTVTWPLLKPALAAAFLLGFVESLADFGNPLVLGGEYEVLSTRIFFAIAGARHEPGRAAALAILLLILTLGAFALQTLWLGKRRYTTVTG